MTRRTPPARRASTLLLRALLATLSLLLAGLPAGARGAPLDPRQVPSELAPWIPWALDGAEDARCGALDGAPLCVWPGLLELDVKDAGGAFALLVHADRARPVPLPGALPPWPLDVLVDGKPAVVLAKDGRPFVEVEAGPHRVTGRFAWTRAPESLAVPAEVGLISLSLDGGRVETPRRTDDRLWLRAETGSDREPERIEIEVFRRLDDGVPLRVTTRLSLRASGRTREVAFGRVLLAGSTPLSLESTLPARVEKDGALVALVRAGQHTVTVSALFATPPESLRVEARPAPWPEREVWVWAPAPALREVDLAGGVGVEASRTNLPAEWQSLRALLLGAGDEVRFSTSRRGEPMPPPNALSLDRTLWLDLDGGGFTVRDRWTGRMHQAWRLDLREGDLGHVRVGGESQLITLHEAQRGVELRSGEVDLVAESRLSAPPSALPAVGWSENVQSLRATLHLPPGWEVLGALGVDSLPGTWIASWNLFALFFVLVASLAAGKLAGRWVGLLALVTLVITHDRQGAPNLLWVALLVVMALLSVVPRGWLRQLLRATFVVIAASLVIVASSFGVAQLRDAFFPAASGAQAAVTSTLEEQGEGGGAMRSEAPASRYAPLLSSEAKDDAVPQKKGQRTLEQDPSAVIQTGPGVPTWSWGRWELDWTGPVTRDHRVRLYLLSPAVNAALGVARLALVALLALALLRRAAAGPSPPTRPSASRGAVAAAVAATLLAAPGTAAAEPPSKELVEELRARLTRKAECEPACVAVSHLELVARGAELTLALEVHAGAPGVLQLPGPTESWVPRAVSLDDKPAAALVRGKDGFLHLRVPAGRHRVKLVGPLLGDELTLALGLAPAHVTARVEGWIVDGLGEDGRAKGSVHLSRTAPSVSAAGPQPSALPPWFEVTRELTLGVSWQVVTRVVRASPPGTPAVLRVPLLPGERVTSEGALVEGGEAVLSFDRDRRELVIESALETTGEVAFTAAAERPLSEVWRVDCGPIWHCRWEGTPPVAHQREGRLGPEFRPWPGERLRLVVDRPQPAPGASTTVDRAELAVEPGARLTAATLRVTYRTSTGGLTYVMLPEGADVRKLSVGGREVPIRTEGRKLSYGLTPGTQEVVVEWQEPRGLSTVLRAPEVSLPEGAVDVRVRITVPRERWLLLARGPAWGPAVLFWLYLGMALGAAFLVLPRLPKNPLRPYQWALLAVGFTQVPVAVFLVVAAWFFAIAHRKDWEGPGAWQRNLVQLALVGWTLAFLGCLIGAVYSGLATNVDMFVEGGGSSGAELTWYVDRVISTLPTPTVLSLPRWVWRVAMLAWALWLALALLGWLRWSWLSFTSGGLWRPMGVAGAPPATAPVVSTVITDPREQRGATTDEPAPVGGGSREGATTEPGASTSDGSAPDSENRDRGEE